MTLIPFAKDRNTGKIVSIEEVQKGKACNCECPSCHAVLIARHGEQNEWHFAHDSHEYQEATRQCEYSFYVSVAMMAKQLIEEKKSLALPDYDCVISIMGVVSRQAYRKNICITKSSVVKFDSCEVSASHADVVGYIKEIPILVYLDYPKRPYLPYDLGSEEKRGIIVVDLEQWSTKFRDLLEKPGDRKSLADFLFEQTEGKSWKYHPRQKRLIDSETIKLTQSVDEQEQKLTEKNERERQQKITAAVKRLGQSKQVTFDDQVNFTNKLKAVEYVCMRCNISWWGTNQGKQVCQKCFLPGHKIDGQ